MGKSKAAKAKEKKKQARKEKLRKERHQRQQSAGANPSRSGRGPVPAALTSGEWGDGVGAERALHLVRAAQGDQPFPTKEDARRAVSAVLGRDPREVREQLTDPADRAQQLAYDAMEARDEAEVRTAVEAALALDPACFDALRLALELEALRDGEDGDRYGRCRDLADDAMEALLKAGHDEGPDAAAWGDVRARPLMRALRFGLFEAILENQPEDGLRWSEALLNADPGDPLQAAASGAALALSAHALEKARGFIALLYGQAVGGWLHGVERVACDDPRGAHLVFAVAALDDEVLADFLYHAIGSLKGRHPPLEHVPADIRADVSAILTAAAEYPYAMDFIVDTLREALGDVEVDEAD